MTRTLWSLSTFLAVACGNPGTPPKLAPSPPVPESAPPRAGPAIPTGQLTLSGTVTTRGSGGLGGVFVDAWVQTTGTSYSYSYAHGATLSDATGDFLLGSLPESSTLQFVASGDGYFQQCASPPVTLVADAQLNAELVPRAKLSASPDSVPPPAPGFRLITGTVSNVVAMGTAPAVGAIVDYESVMDFPAALVVTDDNGRYLLCGVPDDGAVSICAGSSAGSGCRTIPPGQSTDIDFAFGGD